MGPTLSPFWVLSTHGGMIWAWSQHYYFVFVAMALLAQIANYQQSQRLNLYGLWLLGPLFLMYGNVPADSDINRYFFEAEMWNKGISPYLVAPTQLFDWPGVKDVNHPEWTAIYGPLLIRGMAGWITFFKGIAALKIAWAFVHLGNTFLLQLITQRKDLAILYGLSPFVLLETVGLGHFEELLVLSALLIITGARHHRPFIFGLGLVLAVWIKWWALLLSPLWFRRPMLKAWVIFSILSLWILWPFLQHPEALFHSLWAFKGLWNHGYPYWLLQQLTGTATLSVLAIYSATLLFFVILVGGPLHEQIWQFFRLWLWFSPTLHPWYWIMPLTCALCSGKKTTFLVIGSAALLLHDSKFYFESTGQWTCHLWAGGPLFVLLLFSEWRLRHHIFREKGEWVQKFSLITPVYNEAENCRELGQHLLPFSPHIQEWIVVDAGSHDGSPEIAQSFGAKVLCPGIKGRGLQIHHGVEHAQQDWVVVLHADTRLESHFFSELRQTIAKVPDLDGGAFRMIYRGQKGLGPLRILNELKTRWLGISFGDQTQFFHRQRLQQRGGFPRLSLMEDLELSLILKGGAVAFITSSLSCTSARRWKSDGRIKNAVLIIKLLMIYLLHRHWSPPVDVAHLYRRYYSKKI